MSHSHNNLYRHPQYQIHCLQRSIGTCLTVGGLFTAYDVVARGATLTPRLAVTNIGGLYVYNILQCPMEAVHGKASLLHNVAAGGLLGYIGVRHHFLGIPFVDGYFFMRYPQASPPLVGFAVYGGIAGLLASLSGKAL